MSANPIIFLIMQPSALASQAVHLLLLRHVVLRCSSTHHCITDAICRFRDFWAPFAIYYALYTSKYQLSASL